MDNGLVLICYSHYKTQEILLEYCFYNINYAAGFTSEGIFDIDYNYALPGTKFWSL